MNILKHKGEIYEILQFRHDELDLNNSSIIVKLVTKKQIEDSDRMVKDVIFSDELKHESEYKETSIAIVDNIHYTIHGSYLMGSTIEIKEENRYLCFNDIKSYKLENNFSCLSEKDRITIKSMKVINKYNL